MAWCHQATGHYLNHYWQGSVLTGIPLGSIYHVCPKYIRAVWIGFVRGWVERYILFHFEIFYTFSLVKYAYFHKFTENPAYNIRTIWDFMLYMGFWSITWLSSTLCRQMKLSINRKCDVNLVAIKIWQYQIWCYVKNCIMVISYNVLIRYSFCYHKKNPMTQ